MMTWKSREERVAESWEDKSELIKDEAFPKLMKGMEWRSLKEGGKTHRDITEEDIQNALFNPSVKKVPDTDWLGFKAIRLLLERDAERIITIAKTVFILGVHPRAWNEAKGDIIPKPNKPNY